MSQNLIAISEKLIGSKRISAVSARELHTKLGLKRQFTNWLDTYIDSDDWQSGRDYEVFNTDVKNSTGGRPETDAAFSLEMAEHVAMMTRTAAGKTVRNYFRAARDERDALRAQQPALPDFFNPQTKMLIETLMRVDHLEAEQAAQKDLIIATQRDTITAQETALAAQSTAIAAYEVAKTAIDGQAWVTIRQYCFIYAKDLGPIMSSSRQKSYAHFLGQYCEAHGIPTYKVSTTKEVPWNTENTYPIQTINETLPGWLNRDTGQAAFLVPPTEGV